MREINLILPPDIGFDDKRLRQFLFETGKTLEGEFFQIERRSVDARKRRVNINLRISIDKKPFTTEFHEYQRSDNNVSHSPEIIIVGAGPAGLFAALKAIELGIKPVIFERGKDVRDRRRDIAAINKQHTVNPDSNYCFGEGGAGTYSDGKLYTRSKKRGSVRRIFEILVAHGASENIFYESHPHIGTNKLPKIIAGMREHILERGGEIHFNSRVVDLNISGGQVRGIKLADGTSRKALAVILATGHSARDIFDILYQHKIRIEAKPFALGVRVEHPQALIDQIQYHCESRGDYLPASSYSLVHQSSLGAIERGVFSFCMCPGGFIVPAATSQQEVVVNGMSPSTRNSRYANSGIVVAVELDDIREYLKWGPLAALKFQMSIEQKAWESAGRTQQAPAQRLMDFVDGKFSSQLVKSSYQPGLSSVMMEELLPTFIWDRLKQGFRAFGQKMPGYLTNEAQIVGVESRTSSPVRIPRDPGSLEHVEMKGLYPCGEGAGYAGGIVSAAMDGERVIQKVGQEIKAAKN